MRRVAEKGFGMTRRGRAIHWWLMLGIIVLSAAGFAWPVAVRAAEMPRVRSGNPVVRGLIEEAIDASATFRKIVAAIGATDGIVYVEQGTCYRGLRACLTLSVTNGAGFRFLRVFVDSHQLREASKGNGRVELIGTIGHELWHALEVLTERSLTTTAAIYLFYQREFPTSRSSFETAAAVAAGGKVRKEAGERVGRPLMLAAHQTLRERCAGPDSTLGTDGWWAWPCI
jgi:hypothetical protein